MKRNERDQLLKELLGGDEVAGFRRTSLEQGLAAIRRTRRRRTLRMATLIALPVLLAAALLARRSSEKRTTSVASVPSVPLVASVPSPSRPASAVKFISDEDLLALFPGRSVALIGPPGHQRLVFLDEPGAQNAAQGL